MSPRLSRVDKERVRADRNGGWNRGHSLIGLYHSEKQAGTSQACGEKITIARNALKLADPSDKKAIKDAIDAIYKIDDCSSTYVIQFAGQNQSQNPLIEDPGARK